MIKRRLDKSVATTVYGSARGIGGNRVAVKDEKRGFAVIPDKGINFGVQQVLQWLHTMRPSMKPSVFSNLASAKDLMPWKQPGVITFSLLMDRYVSHHSQRTPVLCTGSKC